MIKFEYTEVVGWTHAIRGMRNAKESWDRSDSAECDKILCSECPINDQDLCPKDYDYQLVIGTNDLNLGKQLCKAGTDHRKFLRMIIVYADIIAPLYWWKQFDQYKVGVTTNSCSTMHRIHAKELTFDDFSHEDLINESIHAEEEWCSDWRSDWLEALYVIVERLNRARQRFLDTKDKKYWQQMIQLLPSSYNQRRTVIMNYEVLANIYKSRKNHKLDEWRVGFCDWIRSLPYSELITGQITPEMETAEQIEERDNNK